MRTIKDIINFDGVVKNRRNPFKLALKDGYGYYVCAGNKRSYDITNPDIYDYFSKYAEENKSEILYDKKFFEKKGETIRIFLISAAGEIELREKDFRKMKRTK